MNQFFLLVITIGMFSCQSDEGFTSGLMEDNLESLVQTFTLDLESTSNKLTFETDAGCTFIFSPQRFTFNGSEVSGEISIDVIEIFDKGTMAITGKHTMTDNDSILISGGEFFIKAYQGEDILDYPSTYKVDVPIELSGTYSNKMQLFTGGENFNSSQSWVSAPNISDTWGVFNQSDVQLPFYQLHLTGFQWFNCDRFVDDPRPSIDLDIKIPSEFDNQNSIVYLALKGEKSSLGIATKGKYPEGMDIHLIFVSEVDGQFIYQVISDTISDKEYKFDRDLMQSVTPDALKKVINELE